MFPFSKILELNYSLLQQRISLGCTQLCKQFIGPLFVDGLIRLKVEKLLKLFYLFFFTSEKPVILTQGCRVVLLNLLDIYIIMFF